MIQAEKLYITVEDGKVTEIWYDSDYDNQNYLLTEGTDYVVEYVQKRPATLSPERTGKRKSPPKRGIRPLSGSVTNRGACAILAAAMA